MTRAANAAVDAIHHRMPVVLDSEERDAWLNGTEATDIGARANLRSFPVARFGLLDDGVDLIEPIDP